MASGTITGSTNNEYIASKIVWSSTPTTSTNKSKVTAGLYYKRTNSGYTTYGTGSFSLTVAGSKTTVSKSVKITESDWVLVLEVTVTVEHDSDGSKKIAISAAGGISGTSLSSTSCSGTAVLDTIARASTITSAAAVTLGNACSIKWTPASASFRYKLKFVLGDWSHTTGAIHPNQTAAYTYTGYVIPLDVAKQLPDAATGDMTVTLYTYSNSAATTQVGSADSKTFKVTVPNDSNTQPTVTMELSPVSTLGDAFDGLYIQGATKVKATLSAAGKYSASIKSYSMKVDGVTYDTDDSYTSEYLSNHGDITVYGYAKDSRGYTGSASEKITVISYAKPQIQAATGESDVVAARCDENGNLNDSGTYLKIKAKRSYSPVKSGGVQHNFCKIRYRYKLENATSYSSWTTILARDSLGSDEVITGALLGGVLAVDNTYLVQVQAIDDVGENGYTTITIPTDKVYMHRDKVRRALAFGKYIQDDNTIDVADDITVKVRGELVVIGNGWITPTIGEEFELYSAGAASAVRYRKIAGIVEVRGAVKPKSAITGTDTTHTIFTLPEGYRPDNVIRVLCQGSYWYHWLLMIKANGEVSFSRYSDGNSFLEAPTTAWLPFQVTFIADQ